MYLFLIQGHYSDKQQNIYIQILYVEDDLPFAESIKKRLLQRGIDVKLADTSAKALKLFSQTPPDLVMVDLDLQYQNEGLKVINDIFESSPWFPIIVYSAHVEPEIVIETMRYGVMHHVGKTRTLEELVAAIQNALYHTYHSKEGNEYKLSGKSSYKITNRKLTISGENYQLKRIEGLLFQQLCVHMNEFVSPQELMIAMWGYEKNIADLCRYILRLRKIIERDPSLKIINQSGGFYQLECKELKSGLLSTEQ